MTELVTVEVVVLLAVMILAIGIDIYLNFAPPAHDTFSYISREWARESPFWPWMVGLLAGRFFHWGQSPVVEQPWGLLIMAAISAALVGFFSWQKIWRPIRSAVGIPAAAVLGYVVGALFWPVNAPPIDFV